MHSTKVAHLVLALLLFLFFASLLNIPLVFAQVNNQPAISSQLMIADESPPAVSDPNLRIDRVATDLNRPTAMAFLGNSSDDIIVTEKDNGTVQLTARFARPIEFVTKSATKGSDGILKEGQRHIQK